jgi:hypothetical protein
LEQENSLNTQHKREVKKVSASQRAVPAAELAQGDSSSGMSGNGDLRDESFTLCSSTIVSLPASTLSDEELLRNGDEERDDEEEPLT